MEQNGRADNTGQYKLDIYHTKSCIYAQSLGIILTCINCIFY